MGCKGKALTAGEHFRKTSAYSMADKFGGKENQEETGSRICP